MTGTVVDALQDATAELHAAAQLMQALGVTIQQNLTQTTASATTIINNFLGRPPVLTVFVDPVNGDDTKDGSTVAFAKKSIDTVLDNIGITATTIILLNDAVIRRRRNVYASLTLYGAQPSNGGYIFVNRKISFLGTAENSPIAGIGTFCSGFWFLGTSFLTNYITFNLPTQTAGQDYASHLFSDFGVNITMANTTLTVDTAAAGKLLGSHQNAMNVYASIALGANAAGHLFENVAAGTNPNAVFQYRTNITSG